VGLVTLVLPADACTPDRNRDLSLFQPLPLLHALQRGLCLVDPQIMIRVCVDANVGLGRLGRARRRGCRRHDDGRTHDKEEEDEYDDDDDDEDEKKDRKD
jgi:hypothetical protein